MIKNVLKFSWREKYSLAVLLFIIALLDLSFDTETAVLWGFFLSFVRFGWDYRIVGGLALFCLTTCPLLLYLQLDAVAELMAVYAYYFLFITVVLQIVELIRFPERLNEEQKNLKN